MPMTVGANRGEGGKGVGGLTACFSSILSFGK